MCVYIYIYVCIYIYIPTYLWFRIFARNAQTTSWLASSI